MEMKAKEDERERERERGNAKLGKFYVKERNKSFNFFFSSVCFDFWCFFGIKIGQRVSSICASHDELGLIKLAINFR